MVKNPSKKTISFYTLGCRLNQSETTVIQRTFENDGYHVVDFNHPADVVVINTCTVTENGDAETRRLVSKVNRLNPSTRIALIGCQAQMQKEKLAHLPNVQWVVGNGVKMGLQAIVEATEPQAPPQVITPTIHRERFTMPAVGIDRFHTRANIKIQDGCDFFCSFCEIPYARGRARSRVFDDILLEANALAAAGHKELVITGINVGTYEDEGKNLLDVIEALEQIEGLKRIRISSIEPTTIPDRLIQKMAEGSKLCRYLHIPLQSGHNTILQEMKRKYTVEEFSRFVQYTNNTVKEICIGTDVIVGFPGETDEHFQQTVDLLKTLPIHYFHVFSYSKRTMAQSGHLPGAVDPAVIHQRSKTLRHLSQRKRDLFYQSLVGTTQEVLFEETKGGMAAGMTDNFVRALMPSNIDLHNHLKRVDLISCQGSTLLAETSDSLSHAHSR
jgi:threonylcarbamoyladenosine tRNA methylthiotransferase MtaB